MTPSQCSSTHRCRSTGAHRVVRIALDALATVFIVLLMLIDPRAACAVEPAHPTAPPAPAQSKATHPVIDTSEKMTFGRFGDLAVYRPSGEPREVVLFLSGDGGWDEGVVIMAQRLAQQGAAVVGIHIRHYMESIESAKEACVSPTVDLENLSHFIQAKLGIARYIQPTLVGYSSGATFVYATLVEAPANLFKGGLSIGFCPDLDLKKRLCKGEGIQSKPRKNAKGEFYGVDFLVSKKLSARWISLQGAIDEVCPPAATQRFMAQVPGAEMVLLPKVGHGYAVEKNWLTQYLAAYARIVGPARAPLPLLPASVADLPLVEVPATASGLGNWMAVFLSGDGGWVGLDRGVAERLAAHGIPVVGWDSLRYFWSPRSPQGAADDLDRVIRHYSRAWQKPKVLLLGYSQGADTLPFMVNRLPANSRGVVGLTALLGLSDSAYFEFHVTHWLGNPSGGLPTLPEMRRWTGAPFLCIYGEDETDSPCATLREPQGRSMRLPGGHHFGGGYAEIADRVVSSLTGG